MHDDEQDKKQDRDDDQPSPLAGRRYDLAEAIGRAGAGNLKGASPVARNRRTLLAVGQLLESHLEDNDGSLRRTILARLELDPPLLAAHGDEPAAALAAWLDGILASDEALARLVQDADVRWGREYDERPRFERPGRAPHPDDPYTRAGTAAVLAALRRAL